MSNVVPLLNPAVRGEYAIEMLAREICKAEGLTRIVIIKTTATRTKFGTALC